MVEKLSDFDIRNDVESVMEWLAQGHDVNMQDEFGETLLHKAIDAYNLEVVETLLIYGANPNTQEVWGHTPLHRAIDTEVQKLINEGLDEGGVTAVKMLIRAGARSDLPDRDGKTPLDWARELGHESARRMMEKP